KKKRDTNPNEVQNVQIFRCVDEEIKAYLIQDNGPRCVVTDLIVE
ncbi:15920_t:CDS:2, partial [Racocetra fulgida]